MRVTPLKLPPGSSAPAAGAPPFEFITEPTRATGSGLSFLSVRWPIPKPNPHPVSTYTAAQQSLAQLAERVETTASRSDTVSQAAFAAYATQFRAQLRAQHDDVGDAVSVIRGLKAVFGKTTNWIELITLSAAILSLDPSEERFFVTWLENDVPTVSPVTQAPINSMQFEASARRLFQAIRARQPQDVDVDNAYRYCKLYFDRALTLTLRRDAVECLKSVAMHTQSFDRGIAALEELERTAGTDPQQQALLARAKTKLRKFARP